MKILGSHIRIIKRLAAEGDPDASLVQVDPLYDSPVIDESSTPISSTPSNRGRNILLLFLVAVPLIGLTLAALVAGGLLLLVVGGGALAVVGVSATALIGGTGILASIAGALGVKKGISIVNNLTGKTARDAAKSLKEGVNKEFTTLYTIISKHLTEPSDINYMKPMSSKMTEVWYKLGEILRGDGVTLKNQKDLELLLKDFIDATKEALNQAIADPNNAAFKANLTSVSESLDSYIQISDDLIKNSGSLADILSHIKSLINLVSKDLKIAKDAATSNPTNLVP